MKSRPMKITGAVIGAAMVAGLWVFFAPTSLGGSTTYSVTSGISMQPMLYKNDLALVRAESSYHVGEVVLYQNQLLHRPVLHRIILIQNGNYFFKGDNNNFVDPGLCDAGRAHRQALGSHRGSRRSARLVRHTAARRTARRTGSDGRRPHRRHDGEAQTESASQIPHVQEALREFDGR
jgi:signal peptidase I